jgi:hypothetical protein
MPPLEAGGPSQPQSTVILHNRRTGAIFSTHYFSAAPGATLPDKEELKRVALAHAAKDGCDTGTHKALHLDPAALERGIAYRVSPPKGVLTAVKTRRRRTQSLTAGRSSKSR